MKYEKYIDKPEIVYLVGLPGSGKSTYIKKYLPNHVVISNDNIVEKYAKQWKTNYNAAWEKLDFKVVTAELQTLYNKAIKEKKNIVIDNTNMTPKARKKYDHKDYIKNAVVFEISDSELKNRQDKRNKESGKLIPDSAIKQMKSIYKAPTKEEGFIDIKFVRG